MIDFPPALVAWLHEALHTSAAITAALLPSRSESRSYRLTVGESLYVLKLIHPCRATAVAHELAIVPYLHACGFPVPDVLAIAPDLPGVPERAMLRTHLDGTPASERFPTLDAAARADLLAAIGELLARIHSLPLAAVYAFWQYPEDTVHAPADWATNFVQKKVASDLSVLTPSGALADDVIADLQVRLTGWAASLAEAPIALAPLHGDFYLDNLLVTEDGAIAGLLDWEAARLGDPLWELARTQVASFGDAPAEYARFHDAYCRHIPLAVDEERIARYRFLMAMGDLRYAIRHAPELTAERAAYVTRFWRQIREAPGWS
ncbi:MAG: phosphotransferase family protein [Thermomicrobiales bacterium]